MVKSIIAPDAGPVRKVMTPNEDGLLITLKDFDRIFKLSEVELIAEHH